MLSRLIFINGIPGCGKSIVGGEAARDTGVPFLDLDLFLEERAGLPLSDILTRYGEEGFRRMETGALAFLTRCGSGVIALGGGAAMSEINRKIIRGFGSVLMLERKVESILPCLRAEKHPLLGDVPEEYLLRMAEPLLPVYRRMADLILPNEGKMEDTVALLVRVLRERYHA